MRFIKISNVELIKIRKLYEGLMSYACYGLFFREGLAIGEEFVTTVKDSGEEYLKAVKNVLEHRGWAKEIKYKENKIIVKESAESEPGNKSATCHIMRGILQKVMEEFYGKKIRCTEEICRSMEGDKCVFAFEAAK